MILEHAFILSNRSLRLIIIRGNMKGIFQAWYVNKLFFVSTKICLKIFSAIIGLINTAI